MEKKTTSSAAQAGKIPVVFDTDICDDIDDTWALVMLLQSPEFDIKLITTAVNNTPEKAKVVAVKSSGVVITAILMSLRKCAEDGSCRLYGNSSVRLRS